MLQDLETRFAVGWPVEGWGDVTVLLAVSGGADSVALLRVMSSLKKDETTHPRRGQICVGHFNHRLRPEAEADEQFVRELCAQLGILCEVGRAEARQIAACPGEGIEEGARRWRYEYLKNTAERLGARYVVMAHTADDQAETILHRILRGTGLAGLSGIARTRTLGHASLIRPLLGFRRHEIERYLADLGQPFCQDGSNSDCRFTRNRIRHELLPQLMREYNAQAVEAILRLGILAGEVQTVVDRALEKLFARNVSANTDHSVRIDLTDWETTAPYLWRELFMLVWQERGWPLQAMGFDEWSLLVQMARESFTLPPRGSEKRFFPGAIRVETVPGEMKISSHYQYEVTDDTNG